MNVSKDYSFYHIIYRVSLIGILPLIVSSCAMLPEAEQEAQVDMPKSYSSNGLEFKYPGNWTVQDLGNHFATVESPGNAIVSIFGNMEPSQSLSSFAEEYQEDMKGGMPGFISVKEKANEDGTPATTGEHASLSRDFTISVMGNPLLHKRRFHRLQKEDEVLFVVTQVAMEDLSTVKPGFDLILDSLNINSS
ncbi:MAG: hypothetical protein HOK49_11670 [Opitutae bacterium]|jgi:hypothetical protein|nr:hypothetical protein [Opitutae bacterium]MBT5380782.1 hypothetical protein [Opitutae bacterium]MBT5692563.1 hypothetical protein [Opitutae bacterium]MBT6463183.1 hypothetical protein [Opitutae bacterium]MBT6957076.1 hypothetical protein [Opitutae bacterium]